MIRFRFARRVFLTALCIFVCGVARADAAPQRLTQNMAPRQLFFTVWTSSPEECREYARLAKNLGFDGIDFVVNWDKFEPQEGVFDWKYLDECLAIFRAQNLKLSLSAMFWVNNLPWAQKLNMQQHENGETYFFEKLSPNPEDKRGPNLSYNDPRNLFLIERALREFARHANQKHGDAIVRFHARTSHYGELEYTPLGQQVDFSPLAIGAFKNFLRREYSQAGWGGLAAFNRNYKTSLANWNALDALPIGEVLARSTYDWQRFRQHTVLGLSRVVARGLRAGAPDKMVALQIGAVWDEAAATARGAYDPYLLSRDVDILHTDDAPGWPHDFSLDLISSIASDRLTAMELSAVTKSDGNDLVNGYLRQLRMGGESNLTFVNTANWSPDQIEKWTPRLLSQYRPLFVEAVRHSEARRDRAILFNTADFLVRKQGLDKLLLGTYQKLGDNGQKRVRFVTDSMILQKPLLLRGLKSGLYLGAADSFSFDARIAQVLARANCALHVEGKSAPKFRDPFGNRLEGNVEATLLKNIVLSQ